MALADTINALITARDGLIARLAAIAADEQSQVDNSLDGESKKWNTAQISDAIDRMSARILILQQQTPGYARLNKISR